MSDVAVPRDPADALAAMAALSSPLDTRGSWMPITVPIPRGAVRLRGSFLIKPLGPLLVLPGTAITATIGDPPTTECL